MGKKQQDNSAISLKSTKEQILEAYNLAMSKLTEKKADTPQEQLKKAGEAEVVSKAARYNSDDILSEVNGLKVKTIKRLDSLSEELLAESTKLSEIRKAIDIERNHIKELYLINETANSLSVLLQAQEEKREEFNQEIQSRRQAFEQEMSAKKQELQADIKNLGAEYAEKKEKLETARKREEEEYKYNLEVQWRNEINGYNLERLKYQTELNELKDNLHRQKAEIAAKEEEFKNLKLQAVEFPEKLATAVKDAKENISLELKKEYEFMMQIKAVENRGALALSEQQVKSLEAKIKEYELLLKELSQKADTSMQQVQNIACKALDSAAVMQRVHNITSSENREKT